MLEIKNFISLTLKHYQMKEFVITSAKPFGPSRLLNKAPNHKTSFTKRRHRNRGFVKKSNFIFIIGKP
jgi:hypothetical protein